MFFICILLLKSRRANIDPNAYTGTYVSSSKFTTVNSRLDLKLGDIGLYNNAMSGGNSNHVGMYLGRALFFQEVWIECTGKTNGVHIKVGPNKFLILKRYNGF